MSRRRLARSLGLALLALSCGCSLLFSLDALQDGGTDAGDDTGAPDAVAEGDAVAFDVLQASADVSAADGPGGDAPAADAREAGEGGPGSDAAGPDADASRDADASTTGDADASRTGDAGPVADADAGTDDAGTLASGLVVHLTFDETSGTIAHDTSGNGNDGMLLDGATFAPGILSNAATLNGAGQYVALPAAVTQGLTAFSVTAWVHLNPAPDAALANWSRLFDFGTGTMMYAFLVPDNGGNGNIRFAITTNGNGNEQRIEGPSPLPTGAWEHVAVTSASGVGTLYVNGAQVAQNTAMTLTLASLGATTQNWLGRSQFPGDPYLAAQIDDLRLYSRALDSGEVALLYAQH